MLASVLDTIDPRVAEIALSCVGGADFENFCQSFFASTLGNEYVPMGGHHDGGADGALDERIFGNDRMQKFLQASTSSDFKTRIRGTVRRLREVGRDPKSLIYATSVKLKQIDKIEEELSDELECRIIIRDRSYFQHQINESPGTIQAYKSYLEGAASFLSEIGGTNTVKQDQDQDQDLPSKALCVFIGQELDRNQGKIQLLEAVSDSLILWALEGTDPDKEIFLSLKKIRESVLEALPSAKQFFTEDILERRLDILSSKDAKGNRKVRFHRKEKGYCLPYVTRETIREENVEDETLRLKVSDVFTANAFEMIYEISNGADLEDFYLIGECVQICHDVIHESFLAQGLEITLFLEQKSDGDANLPAIMDLIGKVIKKRNLTGKEAEIVFQLCWGILRKTYYDSTEAERRYLRKLSRTYVLLFMLKNEPRVVEYFRTMSSRFNLYIGSDLIVKCLSEHLLKPEDQTTKNALKLFYDAGSKLILTDLALDEVWNHLKITHFEFVNNYRAIQHLIDLPPLVELTSKILIKAFFYARIERRTNKKGQLTWESYLNNFLPLPSITNESSKSDLREYLINEFNFKFEDEKTMLREIDKQELDELTEKILENRGDRDHGETNEEKLSQNSAATVLRIYQRRIEEGERRGGNPYGFKTWWLTQRKRIHVATKELVKKKQSPYLMRPEFIVHFLASFPPVADVQKSYEKIFPTMLGIKLSNRMDEEAFKKIIEEAQGVFELDESRAKVILANASSQLQANWFRQIPPS